MPFSLTQYQTFLANIDSAQTNQEKGQSLENLIEYLMGNLPGILVIGKDANCGDEELDVVLFNYQSHQNLRSWDSVILVECKNWTHPVGSQEINWFLTKMEERNVQNGIFVALNGVTGNFTSTTGAKRLIINALRQKIRVILLTRADLDAVTNINDFCDVLRDKYCKLFLTKVL